MSPTSRSTPESTGTDLAAAPSAGAHSDRASSPSPPRGRAGGGAGRGAAVAWGTFGVLVTVAAWWAFTHAAAGGSTMIAA
ncbi:MAG TPA: ABC transporter permease, partial [Kocuria sp.]|nr:ABC transporter permease [Kocuria sp.]